MSDVYDVLLCGAVIFTPPIGNESMGKIFLSLMSLVFAKYYRGTA